MKKFILTEVQVENLVEILLNEQNIGAIDSYLNQQNEKIKTKEYPVTNSFASGQYRITNTESLDNAIQDMMKEIQSKPNIEFYVIIESSESKVPNRSATFNPEDLKPGQKQLEQGDLSRLRLEKTEQYIKSKIPNIIIEKKDLGAQGPDWTGKPTDTPETIKQLARSEEYSRHQYVKIILYAKGEKNTQIKICDYKDESIGGYGVPNNNFIVGNPIVKDMGDGQGKIVFKFDPVKVPDIFIVEYNGKSYSTKLIGDDAIYYRLAYGTIIGNYYFDKEKPWWFKELKYKEIDRRLALDYIKRYSGQSDISDYTHVFGQKYKDLKSLYSSNDIKPFMLDAGQIQPYNTDSKSWSESNWAITIDKSYSVNIVKFYTIGVIGQTRWTLQTECVK